ncbi:MAG: hypothetical protein ABR912_03600 [Terracidiphilus sp.]|jgi:hypothetical protein
MKHSLPALAVLFASTLVSPFVSGQMPAPGGNPLTRHYREGETLTYHMTGVNEDWHYTADSTGTVKKNANGSYIEEFRWTAMTSNGQPVTLAPAMSEFRQTLSLDPSLMPSGPDLSKVDAKMIGPITDLMTFYVDLWITNKVGILQHAGDHFYVPNPQASSWADGARVIVGKDQIDFDLNIQSIDPAKQTAVVLVHHVPPPHPDLQLPAEWMQVPVADTPNNWVEVTKTKEGKYEAGVGKETFDVTLTVSTADGRILSATMENPVVTSMRECDDAALTKCGAAQPHTIHRHIEIALVH